jgi:hypothetical protein
MKRLIVLSLLMAVTLLTGGFSTSTHAQSPANDLKPTFISPTPGLYVNGWPAFTVSYPKEWEEVPSPAPSTVFMAMAAHPGLVPSRVVTISVLIAPFPLEDWAKTTMPVWVNVFTDIKILSDKPTQLKDDTPAREVEVEFVPKFGLTGDNIKNAPKNTGLLLATKKDLAWVSIWLSDEGKLGEDLKKIAYSLTFQPNREEPVKVPPDVGAFLDMWCADQVSSDLKTIMAHYSDRFRHSGASKAYYEQLSRNYPVSVISCEPTVTVFEAHGDRAYVDGFFLKKVKDSANALKWPMMNQQIINEHGQWKWYGNQK